MKKIKYLGFYDLVGSRNGRVSNLAAVNKMNYISTALVKAGISVDFISASWIGDASEIKYTWFENKKTVNGSHVLFFPSWRTNSKISRNIKIVFTLWMFFIYLMFFVKKDEKIIIYHVPWLSVPVRLAKFFKKFFLILEVEEIYKDVYSINKYFEIMEDKLIMAADDYILSTELLLSRLPPKKYKPLVLYGNYEISSNISDKHSDGFIHLLYAGIIDSHKRGAYNSLEAMKFLGSEYVLHILGFGEVDMLKSEIERAAFDIPGKVFYDGVLEGEDYIQFCSKCHIGLSTQSMSGNYLNSSFPSKILSYLGMGLNVVTCSIECVKVSQIGDLVNYYEVDHPAEIAKAIQSVQLNSSNITINRLKSLENKFINDLKLKYS